MEKTWNELAQEVHQNSVKHGFWENTPSDEHFLCLVISELMEAVDADRIGKRAKISVYYRMIEEIEEKGKTEDEKDIVFETFIKDTVEDELADAMIRILDLAGATATELTMIETKYSNICTDHDVNTDKTFTENIYAICGSITKITSLDFKLNYTRLLICHLAKIMNIDLEWHITHKMEYNKKRVYKHGKSY